MTSRLRIEELEDRSVPATWGNPWPDATHLTLSFAPDGTDLGGQASQLFRTLDAVAPREVWQGQILRAFQAWSTAAGINLEITPDNGAAAGSTGRPQGDPRFGDIRILGGAYSGEVVAFSSPFDVSSGTATGDVRINLSALVSNGRFAYDLYTAMLQEAGHTLGVGNSTDPASVMYELYGGQRTGLSQGDVASIQALYGPRQPDSFEGRGNDTVATASRLNLLKNSSGALAVGVDADLTSGTDRDVYSFTAPSVTGGLVVRLARTSLLVPRLSVLDGAGRLIASTEARSSTDGDLVVRLDRVVPLGQYYVQVEGASGTFAVGSYSLNIQSVPALNSLLGTVSAVVQPTGEALSNNDLHTNDSIPTALNLLTRTFAPQSQFDVAYQGSISDSWDLDYYRIQAPAVGNVMTVMAWGTGASQLLPRLQVYDIRGQMLQSQILVNANGVYCLQVTGVTAESNYFVRMDSVGTDRAATGNYFLGVDFSSTDSQLKTFADGNLDSSSQTATGQLNVRATAIFHFVLAAESAGGTGMMMRFRDANGQLVSTLTARAGEATSLTLTLAAGSYTFEFTAWRTDGKAITSVHYNLKGERKSDPIGPQGADPSDSSTSTTKTSSTQTNWYDENYWYEWNGPGPQSQDPYSNGTRA